MNPYAETFLRLLDGGAASPVPLTGDAASSDPELLRQLGHMVRAVQGVQALKKPLWLKSGQLLWQELLPHKSVGALLLRLSDAATTGVLVLQDGGHVRRLALQEGRPLCAYSNLPEDRFGQYLQREGLLSARDAHRVARYMRDRSQPLGWALLEYEILTPAAVVEAQTEHMRQLMLNLLDCRSGHAAAWSQPNMPTFGDAFAVTALELLRLAKARLLPLDLAPLRELFAPLMPNPAPLGLATAAHIGSDFAPTDAEILQGCREGLTTAQLLDRFAEREAAVLNDALNAFYMYGNLGLVLFADGQPLPFSATPAPRRPQQKPKEFTPAIAVAAHRQLSPAKELAAYQQQQAAVAEAKRLLSRGQAQEAADRLAKAIGNLPTASNEALGYWATALALAGHGAKAVKQAKRALANNKHDALAHAALAHAYLATKEPAKARLHRRSALKFSASHPAFLLEIKSLLALQGRSRRSWGDASASPQPQSRYWLLALAALALLFYASNMLRLSRWEYYYQGTDLFFFFRVGLLTLAGLGGLMSWQHQNPWHALKSCGWSIDRGRMVLAVVWGLMVGALSPMQRVTGPTTAVLTLTLMLVFAEEIFFRAFITRLLIDRFKTFMVAVVLSGVIFGAYHLSYWSFWHNMAVMPKLYYFGLITLFCGIPYAGLFYRTQSLLHSLVCHSLVNVTMMVISLWRR